MLLAAFVVVAGLVVALTLVVGARAKRADTSGRGIAASPAIAATGGRPT